MPAKTFWITLGAAALVCGAALVLQSARNRGLDDRLHGERDAIAHVERAVTNLETAAPDSPLLRGIAPLPGSREEAVAEARAATTSEERVAGARSRLDRLVAGIGDLNRSPADFFRILPDVLRVVQDLSIDELIAVADGIDAPAKMSMPESQTVTRMILYLLAAEQDPALVMRNAELMQEREIRDALLGALGRRDPDAAQRWIKASDLSDREKKEFSGMLAWQVLRRDVDAGLKLMREAGGQDPMMAGRFATAPLPKEVLPNLVAAMARPENADIRTELVSMTLNTLMLDGGVDGARAAAREAGIANEDLAAYFNAQSYQVIRSEPAKMLDWMREVQSPEDLARSLPSAIGDWAQRDYNAAGEWLGTLEPSPTKDSALDRYAQTVVGVDPPAAILWAAEIQDARQRAQSIVRTAEQWLAKDRPAAETWLREKGYDIEALRENP